MGSLVRKGPVPEDEPPFNLPTYLPTYIADLVGIKELDGCGPIAYSQVEDRNEILQQRHKVGSLLHIVLEAGSTCTYDAVRTVRLLSKT